MSLRLRELNPMNLPPEVIELEALMQQEYVEMYGETDQDQDNLIFTGDAVFSLSVGCAYVGFIGVSEWPDGSGKVRALYVHPAFRGDQYASLLLQAAEWYAQHRLGCRTMKFETGPKQQNAVRLYLRHGYSILDKGFGYYENAEGSTFLGKEL